MKKSLITLTILLMTGAFAYAEDRQMHHHAMMQSKKTTEDSRTSLKLKAPMRDHQLSMMREHLRAVNDIVSDIATGKFEQASQTAHQKLGLTPAMKKMCNRYSNADFKKLGLAFHRSADELGDVLTSGDVNKSLNALHVTMNYCVQCHATFRQ